MPAFQAVCIVQSTWGHLPRGQGGVGEKGPVRFYKFCRTIPERRHEFTRFLALHAMLDFSDGGPLSTNALIEARS